MNNNDLFYQLTPEDIGRFRRRVRKGSKEECWPYIGALLDKGYGYFGFKYQNLLTHRLAYFLHYKVNPGQFEVCHNCDNPQCCNPHHLFLGTQADNLQDMRQKGRHSNPPTHIGENHPKTKFTEEQVKEIRRKHEIFKISNTSLAREYQVHITTIERILYYKTWRHIQ